MSTKWLKLFERHAKVHSAPANFSCKSFRDVQTLCNDEDASQWLKVFERHAKVHSAPAYFSYTSFRDVQTLCNDEDASQSSKYHRKKAPSLIRHIRISNNALRVWANRHPALPSSIRIPDGSDRVVIYCTSLRIVRRTYEDCWAVRSILQGFCVPIDERDVSMDNRFLDELHGIIGDKGMKLPLVFIDGKYIGGVDEIKLLFESGELEELINMLPKVKPKACNLCGGHKFMVCGACDGRHKIYLKDEGFVRCGACNVNGLLPCPWCCPRLFGNNTM